MNEMLCPYCGTTCEIPYGTEDKIECPNCKCIFLYTQNSKSHGTIVYRPSLKTNNIDRQMSELKTYYCTTIHNEHTEFYIKSEADEAITELKDKLQNVSSLLKETREWLVESQKLHKRCADNAVKVICHNKYKRCLDNAWQCKKLSYVYTVNACNHRGWNIERYYDKKAELYRKWHKRWLKIAEQFKETK